MERIDEVGYFALPIGIVSPPLSPRARRADLDRRVHRDDRRDDGVCGRDQLPIPDRLTLAGVPAVYFLVATSDYRMRRVTAFLDPWADPLGDGWQMIQSMIAVGTGGVFGRGLMGGVQKLFYLPEPHNDFIYSSSARSRADRHHPGARVLLRDRLARGLRTAVRAPDRFGAFSQSA